MSQSEKPIVRGPNNSLEPLPLSEHPWIKSLRAFRTYYTDVFALAWAETIRFFGWNKRTLLFSLLWVVGAIAGLFTLEGPLVRDQILTTLVFVFAPVGVLTILLTIVNIIRAPQLLHLKQRLSSEEIEQGLLAELGQKEHELRSTAHSLEERHKEVRHYKEQHRTCYAALTEARDKNATDYQRIKELESAKSELEARFLPELSLAYKRDEEHYIQEYANGVKQYRVAAVSTVAMNDAELVANYAVLSDGILNVRHSRLHMRPMHDRNERGTRRVIMKPFEYEFWDIVSEGSGHVWLSHIEAIGESWLAPGKHEIELRITGGQKPAASGIVKIVVSPDNKVAEFSVTPGRLSDRDPRAEGLTFS